MAGVSGTRDLVHVHITDSLPIQMRALPYADRIEIRFGKAFPVALIIDRPALARLGDAIQTGRDELDATGSRHKNEENPS
jgi:hypothetical protein